MENHFNRLPPELFDEILLYVDLYTLLHAQRVSKLFCGRIKASPLLQQALFLQPCHVASKHRKKYEHLGEFSSYEIDLLSAISLSRKTLSRLTSPVKLSSRDIFCVSLLLGVTEVVIYPPNNSSCYT
jgi:F-box domain